VSRVENVFGPNAQPLGSNGFPIAPPAEAISLGVSTLNNEGSPDGEFSDQDRLTAIDGRLANPKQADEIVVSALIARVAGWHVGETVPIGFYTNVQSTLPGYGTGAGFKIKPYMRIEMKVAGIVAFNNQVVLDSLDATATAEIVYTPALVHRLVQCCINNTTSFLRLDGGAGSVTAVEREIQRAAGPNVFISFGVKSSTAVAERAIKPESIALGVFGGIAALAALLIAGQAMGRQLRFGAEEEQALRALGASPAMIMGDGLVGLLAGVFAGSLLAVAVAVGLSPLAPIGVVRPVYPDPGVAFDWTVFGLGFVVLVLVLTGVAGLMAYRQAPHRVRRQVDRGARRQFKVISSASGPRLPAPAVEGIRFALDPGTGRNTVPVRSVIAGTTLAIVVVVATVTFGASLDSLVSHPRLYGWNWDYELTGGGGIAPVPGQLAATMLDGDRSVAAWSGVYFGGTASVDGELVPVLGQREHAMVSPPVLSGHGLDTSGQIVLGGATLSALHKRVGDTVETSIGGSTPNRLKIVGTATMPIIGVQVGGQHPGMGTGAIVSSTLIPVSASNPNDVSPAGPSAVLVRLRSGANPVTSLRSLRRIAAELTLPRNYGVTVLTVQRPSEIINYRSMGTIPAFLGVGLGAAAVAAVGFTLVASVRRRRRDLALLKTLGFTRRQLAATVAWQSSIVVFLGIVVGVPVGIVVGRLLWNLFAHAIDAVPQTTVPAVTIFLITVGALALANVVAALPGRIAANTSTAILLRVE